MPILLFAKASASSAARCNQRLPSALCASSQLLPLTLATGNSIFWILTISFCSKKILALLISGRQGSAAPIGTPFSARDIP